MIEVATGVVFVAAIPAETPIIVDGVAIAAFGWATSGAATSSKKLIWGK